MSKTNHIEIMATLGPATKDEETIRRLKASGVSFVRVNMSHSSIEEMRYFIDLANKIGIPFVIDTEGSQVRSGNVKKGGLDLKYMDTLELTSEEIVGDEHRLTLRPAAIFNQLETGDVLYLDTGTLTMRVCDTSEASTGKINVEVLSSGQLGSNKGVAIDSRSARPLVLPPLTAKDEEAIKIGLALGSKHVAVSFVRSASDVALVRELTGGKMEIISKIECIDALHNIDEILEATDRILIDRGDLSKEILIENISTAQRLILQKAKRLGKKAFVATNVLETMVTKPQPTRAEVNDIIECVLEGASGLTLAAETAIGSYPVQCVIMLRKLIAIAHNLTSDEKHLGADGMTHFVKDLPTGNTAFFLNAPNGGTLVNRCASIEAVTDSATLRKVEINERQYMDLEAIAVGTFSPLEGFMTADELEAVLQTMRMPSGTIWPLPIVLDLHLNRDDSPKKSEHVLLTHGESGVVGMIEVSDVFELPKQSINQKLYATEDPEFPGVRLTNSLGDVALGGRITLFKPRISDHSGYEFTPRQVRRMFAERNWSRVVSFHTRNVPHRGHEFIQQEALKRNFADGLLLHPVIGKKKTGDFLTEHILKSYELLVASLPEQNAILSAFSTYSRYAGPREALFTALCRKNYGCSHFIVGRDHTGGGGAWGLYESHDIFEQFPDLGIEIIKMKEVAYDEKSKSYVEVDEKEAEAPHIMRMSATKIREYLRSKENIPSWFVRDEIASYLASIPTDTLFVPQHGTVIWMTGLSGSGKTTLATHLADAYTKLGKKVALLDGDAVRADKHIHLPFSREGIIENNRLVAHMAKEKQKTADIVIVSLISPYRENRATARSIVDGDFVEVFIDAPLEEVTERDPKGHYKKVATGEVTSFIGVTPDSPYERPLEPDIHLETHKLSIDECVAKVLERIR